MITNIYRIRAYDLIMCGYFCVGFIDLLKVKVCLIKQTYFLLMIMRRMIKKTLKHFQYLQR